MKLRARIVTKLPATLNATGGLKVVKQNGVWTFSPDWTQLTLETSLPDAASRHLWTLNPNTNVYTRLSVQALIDNLPDGPPGDDGSLIFVQDSTPATSNPEGSIWVDSDSSDQDLYQLVSSVWTDTGTDLKGDTGPSGESPQVFVENSAPSTVGVPDGSLWVDADSAQNDLYQLQTGSWVDTGVNLKGADGSGTGDVTSNTATSVDSEIALFNSTTGKQIKRASTTGVLKATSGVLAAAVAGTDYLAPAAIGVTVQGYDADTLKADVSDNLDVGFTASVYNAGTQSTGTYTPNPANGNLQRAVNGGAHTLAPPSSDCTIIVQYTNNGTAGAVTTSGFTKVDGSFTTTNGDDFMCYITRVNSFMHLNIVRLQ